MYFYKPHRDYFPWIDLYNNSGIFHIYKISVLAPYKIVLIDQMPFHNHIYKHHENLSIYLKTGLEINLPAFNPDILMFIIILLVYKTFGTFPNW